MLFALCRQDSFLLDNDADAVEAVFGKMNEQRSTSGVSTGASSDKAQSWVNLHMSIAEKRF